MEEKQIIQKESIKLMKMSKGYQWEIKVLAKDLVEENSITRIKILDDKLNETWNKNE